MPEATDATPLAEEKAVGEMALLVIDMFSDWSFPDADSLLAQAGPLAPRISELKARCERTGIPTIYVNDNQGRWRSDFRALVETAAAEHSPGRHVARLLKPAETDYFVLKPKHSAFHATPLDLLLRHLAVRKLVVAGVSADQCVLYTAADARMHDYEVLVPHDLVASQTETRNDRALRHMEEVLGISTTASRQIDLPSSA